MMKKLIYISTLLVSDTLTPCLSHGSEVSGNLSINVVPPGTTPPPPPQAAAAGFTTLARNSDFRVAAPDIGCNDEPGHQWYVHTYGYMYADCTNIHWPYTDPVTGETAARFNWNLMNKPDTSFLSERTGLSSVNQNGSSGDTFPLDGYYECRVRVQPFRFAGGWWNCWMDGIQFVQNQAGGMFEFDMNEFHSGYAENFNFACLFGVIHNWWAGGGGDGAAFYQNGCGTIYDPSNTMHTTGMLIQTNQSVNPPLIRMRAYWDNNLIGDTGFYNPQQVNPLEPWYAQRNYLQWNVAVGCNEQNESYGDCINMPLTRVQDDGGGHAQLVVDGSNAPTYGKPIVNVNPAFEISVGGVGGATNANGIFIAKYVDNQDTCTSNCRINIFNVSTGAPITYGPSAYTSGGVWNPTPNGIDMIASYFRVWTCSDWKTSNHCAIGPGH
jgi:hypothetical protein